MCDAADASDRQFKTDLEAFRDSLPDDVKKALADHESDPYNQDARDRFNKGLEKYASDNQLEIGGQGGVASLLLAPGDLTDDGLTKTTFGGVHVRKDVKEILRNLAEQRKATQEQKTQEQKTTPIAPDKTDLYLRSVGIKRATGSQAASFLGGY